MPTDNLSPDVALMLQNCRRLVIFTGAGVSKESGIPTFRDKMTGLWANCDPGRLATPEGFLKDPSLVWRWYDWRRQLVRDCEPNPGHLAIVAMEKAILTKGGNFTLITQNVDRLHQRAGSSNVLELHGNIVTFRCFERGHQHDEKALGPVDFGQEFPPLCACGSLLRPNVVWFGEALPVAVLTEANKAAKNCDVMIVVGTSALVQPAASVPYIALDNGAQIIEVNPDETALTRDATTFVRGVSGAVMPQLMRFLEGAN